ncbi:MAG: T9SS type A sorting domain-containing protein [Candidatus Symbiothrix sp.]|jgi:hypothetical protein|nr:T9SS type A sorting domain-containing protein [Candidatus Symbiothrix sp.]
MNKFFFTLLLISASFSTQAQSFFIMEGSGTMFATSISSDGNYVVGKVGEATMLTGHHSFVWTKSGGVVEKDLDIVNPDGLGASARGVSVSGRVVGVAPNPDVLAPDTDNEHNYPYITGAFRDITADQWTILPRRANAASPFYGFSDHANAVSDDGTIIVGGFTPGWQGNRWAAGYWDVSNPENPVIHVLLESSVDNDSEIFAISGDGKVMGGHENNNLRLWIYDESSSQYVKTSVADSGGGEINAVSQNGQYAIYQNTTNNFRAAIYNIQKQQTTNFDYNTIKSGAGYSRPMGVSNNGIVVGYWGQAPNPLVMPPIVDSRRAFIYAKTLGMIELKDLLTQQGIDYQGVDLLVASGISADGRKIIGYGNKDNKQVAFYVEIPEIVTQWMPVQRERIESPAYGEILLTWAKPEASEDATLAGYAVYEEDTHLEEITDPETLSCLIENVEDGSHHYTIRAIYQEDENKIESRASRILTITVGRRSFPFFDDFSDYQPGGPVLEVMDVLDEIPLSTGYWDASSNTVAFANTWKASEFGYSHWCARFVTPGGSNYDESLTSPYFSTIGAPDAFLSFNIGIPTGGAEDKVSIEIFDGNEWTSISEIPANDGGKWRYKTYDVSSLIEKENVRFRFRAQGNTSLQWLVDNVEFTDSNYRMNTNSPLTVSARAVPAEGTVHVNWSDPEGFVNLRYMWDDDVYQGAIANSIYPFVAANMYPAEDLKDYEGYYLTSISFWRTTNPMYEDLTAPAFRWFAMQGDERIVDEEVVDSKYKWNTVQLAEPVQIDVTQPLYYGVEVESCDSRDWPLGAATFYSTDANGGTDLVIADGRGNLYSEDNGLSWRTLRDDNPAEAAALFCIRATLAKDPAKTPQKNIRGYQLFRNDVAIYDQLFSGTGNLVELHNYTDLNPLPAGQEACYDVRIYFTSQVFSEKNAACVTINGIRITASEKGLKVYPNSIRSGETLRVETSQTNGLQLQLFSTAGQKILELKTPENTIDLPMNVEAGIYLLKINGNESLKLMVK